MPRLRRSDCSQPGWARRRAGRGFVYLDEGGFRLTDAESLARIRALAIPPAWQDVWICPAPNGHIQAVGTDAKGRRQYRYHDAWRTRRDREKFVRVLEVGRALPAIRSRCRQHLALDGLPQERVLACAVRLLDVGFFRIGGEEYAEENGTYGLATLLRNHVRIDGPEVIFDYPAKTGLRRVQTVVDPDVREVMAALLRRRGGGPDLLAYRQGRRWIDVRSADINEYLRGIAGLEVTAKDFRTWSATVLAAVALADASPLPPSARARRRAVAKAVTEVSEYLGNTPAVCRSSYIDPRVIDRYLGGDTIPALRRRPGSDAHPIAERDRRRIERSVLALLEEPADQVAA